MLIHPSSAKDDHFDVAAQVLAWSDGSDRREARARIDPGERALSVEGIQAQIDDEPEKWQSWMREFADAAHRCYTALSLPEKARVPGIDDWDEIRRLLLEEVVPGTQLAVINSDETADDRPDFEPSLVGDTWGPPPNHSTIFVSGNVMARGLTLEGLTTTLFTRHSDDAARGHPDADATLVRLSRQLHRALPGSSSRPGSSSCSMRTTRPTRHCGETSWPP